MSAIQDHQVLRRCVFRPYRKGTGPTFRLVTWDTYQAGWGGKSMLGYRLTMTGPHPCGDAHKVTCGRCRRSWCEQCDPAPAAMCHWCNGNGGSKHQLGIKPRPVVLFEGEDFGASPMHAIDSDGTVAALMSFLTLQPGDTDEEYFQDYTQEQLDYCSQHAEALDSEVRHRFGER